MITHLPIVVADDKPLQEKCGLTGVFTTTPTPQLTFALTAASGVQHRGQQGIGLVQNTKKKLLKYVGNGLLHDVFPSKKIKELDFDTSWTLVHCRYGTYGGYQKYNLQPCMATTGKGEQVAVIHNGEFTAIEKMKGLVNGVLPKQASDTFIFTRLLSQQTGKSWDERIIKVISQVSGAFSLIIGTANALYVVRDSQGIRPLIIGRLSNGWLVSSETHAFDKAGIRVTREVERGEIARIDKDGFRRIYLGNSTKRHFCEFEWAYFSRPDSHYPTYQKKDEGQEPEKWLSVATFRERCGEILAHEYPLKRATFVVGTPDSGIHLAIGYANALRLPYRQVIIRDHFDSSGTQRLFMRDDQRSKIKTKVLGKLSFVTDERIWKNAIVVIGDDSIVRGNVSKQITKATFALGAREVHWIVGYPPVRFPCHLGVSMRRGEELIASRFQGDSQKIAKAIRATSVKYISNAGFVKARFGSKKVLHPKDEREIFLQNLGCGGCVTGLYPVSKEGIYYRNGHYPVVPASS